MMNVKYKYTQTGAVLLVSLLILIVMTLLGTAAMKTTVLEEKMAGNYKDNNVAYQAAESALREAENYLNSNVNLNLGEFAVNGSAAPAHYLIDATAGHRWNEMSDAEWQSDASSIAYGSGLGGLITQDLVGVAAQPRYIIEETGLCPSGDASLSTGEIPLLPCYYRVTAQGVGATDTSLVVLQSVYKRY